jgi:hypothetical protein
MGRWRRGIFAGMLERRRDGNVRAMFVLGLVVLVGFEDEESEGRHTMTFLKMVNA